jgi:peroxiredoxin
LRIAEYSLLAARLALAAVFLMAGVAKIVDPVGSRRAFREFGLSPALSRAMLAALPALELSVATVLIPAALAWYGALGALTLLTGFLIAIIIAMIRGRRPDCHCFGQVHSAPVGWRTLARNGFLMGCAGWLVARGRGQSGPALWSWLASLNDPELKGVTVGACLLAFLMFRLIARARPARPSIESPDPSDIGDEESAGETDTESAVPVVARPPAPIAMDQPVTAPGPLDIGLPIGTTAPPFELPSLTGETRSLQSLRAGGCDVVLIFSSPFCKPCEVLASNLVRWRQELKGLPNIVLISRGTPRENLAKLKDFGGSQILLQRETEVAHAYDCSTTPTAVLIGADGRIRTELVSGGLAIKQLLASSVRHSVPAPPDTKAAQRASTFGV